MSLLRRRLMTMGMEDEEVKEWKLLREINLEEDSKRIDIDGLECTELLALMRLKSTAGEGVVVLLNKGWSTFDPYLGTHNLPTSYYEQMTCKAFAKNNYALVEIIDCNNVVGKHKWNYGTLYDKIMCFSLCTLNDDMIAAGSKIILFGR